MSNFQPSSVPESGIDVCSARHDKYFPRSSMVGVKLNTDCVTLPSVEIYHFRWEWKSKRNGKEEKKKKEKKNIESELRNQVNRNTNKHMQM